MNLKKIVGLGLLGVGAAFAEPIAEPIAEPVAESTAPAESQVVAEPVAEPVAADTATAAPAAETAPVAPVAETAPAEPAPAETPSEPIAVPAAPVANQQNAWFAEAAKTEPAPVAKVDSNAVAGTDSTAALVEQPKKNPFDVLHGSAYNTVGNVAAADNVDALLSRPNKMAGRQFFYIEPSNERGVFSVGSIFGAMDISGGLGRGTIGYAMPGFGIAIRGSLGQFYYDGDEGTRYSTEAGDDLGMALSKGLGKYAVVVDVDWNTYQSEEGVEPAYGSSSDENYRNLKVKLLVTNAPGATGTTWTTGVIGLRHESTTEVAGKVIDENADSYVEIKPFFNFGALGLKSEHARLFAGVNASVPVVIYDSYERNLKGKKVDESLTEFGLQLVPNLLGEVALTESALVFGQASFDWLAYAYGSGNDENGSEYSLMQSHMNTVSASAGIRYQYHDFAAIEFAFGDSFFTDTKSIFNGQDVFVSFGGFILF